MAPRLILLLNHIDLIIQNFRIIELSDTEWHFNKENLSSVLILKYWYRFDTISKLIAQQFVAMQYEPEFIGLMYVTYFLAYTYLAENCP